MLELVVAREFVEFLMKKDEVVLNDQHSIWFNTEVGDPTGSISRTITFRDLYTQFIW